MGTLNLNEKEKKLLKKWIKSSNIRKWQITWDGLYLIRAGPDFDLDKHPNLREYFLVNEQLLRKRVGKAYGWTRLHRARDPLVFQHGKPKIYTPYKSKTTRFAMSHEELHASADVYVIGAKSRDVDSFFLLGMLNSSITEFWIKLHAKKLERQHELYPYLLERLPIKKLPKKIIKEISGLTRKIINQAKEDKHINELEEQIDELLFTCIGLTRDEIKEIKRVITRY